MFTLFKKFVWTAVESIAAQFRFSFGIFGICIGVIGASGPITGWYPTTSPAFYWLFVLALIVITIPAASRFIVFLVENIARQNRENRKFGGFAFRPLDLGDLKSALDLFHSQHSDEVTIAIYEAAYRKCPEGWKKIISVRTREIVGYFIVLPLSLAGEKAILEQEFAFSDPSSNNFILKGFQKTRPVYVAMICTINKPSRNLKAFAVKKLEQFLNKCKYSKVYARASTGSGLTLIRKHEMLRVDGANNYELFKTYSKIG